MKTALSRRRWFRSLAAGLCVTAWASARGAEPPVVAQWRTGEIVVDGSLVEWPEMMRLGLGPMVAARNDGQALYLAVASSDTTVRQQLATGLVVWIDRADGRAQTFGLRLEGLAPRPLTGATPDATTDGLDQSFAQHTLDGFDLLGPAKNQRRLIDQPASLGVSLASGIEDRSVVYELKLPLAKTASTPYAVGAAPGATVAIGFETPADPKAPRQHSGLDNPMSTNPWVINPYGGYFNPPPPTNGDSDRPKDVVFKPMKLIWTSVRLAAAP